MKEVKLVRKKERLKKISYFFEMLDNSSVIQISNRVMLVLSLWK